MFDAEQFYSQIRYGESIDVDEVLRYISSFENVILWGAGNLGTAIGEALQKHSVKITEYWDQNAEKIGVCNNVPVELMSAHQFDADKTLIISCINNGSLSDRWPLSIIKKLGYKHALLGAELQGGLNCPLDEKNCDDLAACMNTKGCYLPNCIRYTKLNAKKKQHDDRGLSFQVLTFILSLNCTLNCKYCGQRHSELPKELRRNFDKEAILRDIDNIMESVDFVGMLSLIGGEPFIHPDLAEIVEHIVSKWDNFGIIGITTNGVFRVPDETIRRLNHPQVVINFSLYNEFLTEAQKQLVRQNVESIKKQGIAYTVSHPVWEIPQKYLPYDYSVEYMKKRKSECSSTRMCVTVQNGVFMPCTAAHNITNLDPYDISEDLVDVRMKEGLRQRLIKNQDMQYYHSCRYCSDQPSPQIAAGEQL